MSAEQFLLNIMSLCIYPSLHKRMLQHMININEASYQKIMQERKQLIMKVLFRD